MKEPHEWAGLSDAWLAEWLSRGPLSLRELPTPPEVAELIERERSKTHRVVRWLFDRGQGPHMEERLKLEFYFEGRHVLSRRAKAGKEVVAVDDGIPAALECMSLADCKGTVGCMLPVWGEIEGSNAFAAEECEEGGEEKY